MSRMKEYFLGVEEELLNDDDLDTCPFRHGELCRTPGRNCESCIEERERGRWSIKKSSYESHKGTSNQKVIIENSNGRRAYAIFKVDGGSMMTLVWSAVELIEAEKADLGRQLSFEMFN